MYDYDENDYDTVQAIHEGFIQDDRDSAEDLIVQECEEAGLSDFISD